MKVLYVDTNYDDTVEGYSLDPTKAKYGGGSVIFKHLLEYWKNSHDNVLCLAANPKCYTGECPFISLNKEQRQALRNNVPLKAIIPNADDYDIFFHHFADVHLNLEGCRSQKQVVWPVGWRENVHPKHTHVMMFDIKNQQSHFTAPAKIYNIVIGPKFQPFQIYKKEDFIFQCSRHFKHYHSIDVAQMALKYGVQTYFAGPIEAGYPLMDYIDNKTTHYLGVIDETTKRDYYSRAKLNTQWQDYGISVTLAGKEAASYGCPILATRVGGWLDFIKPGINGDFIGLDEDFINVWNNRDNYPQEECYNYGLELSSDKMIETVVEALKDLYEEIH